MILEDLEENATKDNSENTFKCKFCDKSFQSRKTVAVHMKEYHPPTIKCKTCDDIFEKYSDLELHIQIIHESKGKYECDECNRVFVLKWRLNKHKESHNKVSKKCHYFNNMKICPFDNIGCMFEHVLAGKCKYGKKCSKKLCSFEHVESDTEQLNIEEKHLEEKFDEFTDNEQYEARMVLCDKMCKADLGYHRCEDEEFEALLGCDAANINEEFDDECKCTEYLPCENCERIFENYEELKAHFIKHHKRNELIQCIVENCDYAAKTVNILTMHIGVNHYELIQKKIA